MVAMVAMIAHERWRFARLRYTLATLFALCAKALWSLLGLPMKSRPPTKASVVLKTWEEINPGVPSELADGGCHGEPC